jgi:hypothetical protein
MGESADRAALVRESVTWMIESACLDGSGEAAD